MVILIYFHEVSFLIMKVVFKIYKMATMPTMPDL